MGKDNLHHLYIPTKNCYIGMRIFPNVHHREVLYVQENPPYYPGDFLAGALTCMLLFPSILLSVVHHISGTIHQEPYILIIIFDTHV